jgi:hypothetical protein
VGLLAVARSGALSAAKVAGRQDGSAGQDHRLGTKKLEFETFRAETVIKVRLVIKGRIIQRHSTTFGDHGPAGSGRPVAGRLVVRATCEFQDQRFGTQKARFPDFPCPNDDHGPSSRAERAGAPGTMGTLLIQQVAAI